jgi:isochorismate synthase EntC
MLMSIQSPYRREDIAQRGHELYEAAIRSQVEAENMGKIVAIELATGDFAVAIDTLAAAKQLRNRRPEAQIFCLRIGHRAVHRFGYRRSATD